MSVYNPNNGEYLVIQMVNGDVVFNVLNGLGNVEMVATYKKYLTNNLCDGNWHTIEGTGRAFPICPHILHVRVVLNSF